MIPLVDVPEGQSGDWRVERFEVSNEPSVALLSLAMSGRSFRPGRYTKLTYRGSVIMSDTPAEQRDHSIIVHKATGSVLITGLGLGLVANACLEARADRITIIEKSSDVIRLVGPHWKSKWGDRIEIIEDDALTWAIPRDAKWNAAWHDIWPSICSDNLPEMHRLHRRFGRHVSGYHGSWCRYECERAKRRYR